MKPITITLHAHIDEDRIDVDRVGPTIRRILHECSFAESIVITRADVAEVK